MKKGILLAAVGLIMMGLAIPLRAGADMKHMRIVIPRGSVFILSYFGARDAGIFSKHGIDLEIDARPFQGFIASIPSKEVPATTYAGTAAIERINSGMDLVIIGGGLTVMQEVFVRKDSPYKSVTDLRGKKFGIWSLGAGASQALKVVLIEGFKMDFQKDTEVVQAAPPALQALLKRGDVDSMYNISSLTIDAATHPEQYRAIFSPNAYWKEKTTFPIVWTAPIVAWRDWVEEDPARAKSFVEATHESYQWIRKNSDAAIKKYGKLAAVKTEAEAATYKKWFQEERLFLPRWDEQVVDSQWKFLEAAKQTGVIKAVPPKEKYAVILH